ncbi:hypothetical protein LCGC14_1634930 [marine sediment metagenome]|uniref:Bacteriophage Mu GpT domain-containing protein n=1 Tax=marine sediment metagenome TaxID=412755 RepID=A0A0F9I1H7_9ZZZZ
MSKTIRKPSPEMIEMLRRTGSSDRVVAEQAMAVLAKALQIPLRAALLHGDILAGIYATENLDPSATAEYPLDFYRQDNEDDHIAFTIPSEGAIPTRQVVGDEITVQTFDVGNAIDWALKYARQARWNIVARAMEVLEAGFVRKMNTDGMRVVISAGAGRTDFGGGSPVVYDSAATAGQFTKRLVSLMKTSMTRLAGGNASSTNRGQLTDLYISPEALEDIREWDTDDVDDLTRREIFLAGDGQGTDDLSGPLARIYNVMLHPITELGVSQEFQNYYTNTLSGSMGASDEEIVIGLDLTENDSFVLPVKEDVTVFDDPQLHRRRRAGVYAWREHGFAALDGRRCIIGSF